jgi:two-component system alkaline phosphatase synthesis response regulator PhoP
VLVVDDEPLLVNLLRHLLEHAGFEVTTARNGAEALERARKEPFDLVLTDLLMPVMDGAALLTAIHQEPDPPPVVVLTGYGDQADPVLRAHGARAVLGKPVSPAVLIAAVRQHARPRE